MPKFRTVRFGELDYREEDIIQLSDGLVGMPDLRKWIILEMGDDIPMKWLQSLDRGDFGFPITQSYLYLDDYEVELTAAQRIKLDTTNQEDLAVLIITTVHAGGTKITGNLLAPLVIDTESRLGIQLTLDMVEYGVRQEINYFKFGLAVKTDTEDNATDTVAEQTAKSESDESVQETIEPIEV